MGQLKKKNKYDKIKKEMIKESSKVEEKIKNEREVLNKAEEARLLKKHQSERITKQVELDKINNDSKLSRETKEKLLKDYEENYNNMQKRWSDEKLKMKKTIEKKLQNKKKRELEKLKIKQRSNITLLEQEENSFAAQLSSYQSEQLKNKVEQFDA